MVRELACFSSTAIWVKFALGDVVVDAFVATIAGAFLPKSAYRLLGRSCLFFRHVLIRRGARFLRRFCSVSAFLSAFSFAFGASGSRHSADD